MVQSVRSRSVWIGQVRSDDRLFFWPSPPPLALGTIHRHSSMSIVDELIFGLVLLRQDRFLFFPGEQIFFSRRHREQQSHTENIFVDARQPYSIAALTLIMVLIRHHHQHTTSAHRRAARPNKADRTKPTKPSRPIGFLGCVGAGGGGGRREGS